MFYIVFTNDALHQKFVDIFNIKLEMLTIH